jgi:hypothetical protein
VQRELDEIRDQGLGDLLPFHQPSGGRGCLAPAQPSALQGTGPGRAEPPCPGHEVNPAIADLDP